MGTPSAARAAGMSLPWYASILACADCGTGCALREGGVLWCPSCARGIPLAPNVDLRPTTARTVHLQVPTSHDAEPLLAALELGPPAETFDGPRGQRDATALLSVLQHSVTAPGRVLDLGCGPKDQAPGVLSLGHAYVGVDYSGEAADIRADAHSLPFVRESFDFILTYAVLEHLHNPFVAMNEMLRVLKPGGVMCGTVSQGEPFHGSYFHHTAWGLVSVCTATGFEVQRLWACLDTLGSLGRMSRHSRATKLGLRLLAGVDARTPFLSPRKMRWPAREKALDALHRAGSIGFVVRKPAAGYGAVSDGDA